MSPPTDDATRLLRAVGNTPLVRLPLPTLPPSARLFAKLETTNPGGSLKDRPVLRMLQNAQMAGHFEGGRRLLDAVGANAGVSYALYGAALDIPTTLVLPADTGRDLLDRIRAHGAEVVVAPEGQIHAQARQLHEAAPDRFYFCDHDRNEDNWLAHFETTGHEILTQVFDATADEPDAWVMGVGSGATLCGVARKLRRRRPDLLVAAVVPITGETLRGLRPLPEKSVSFDPELVDRRMPVGVVEASAMCQRLAALGYFVGLSSGAQVAAAARILGEGKVRTAVTVLCDGGERYATPPPAKKRERHAAHDSDHPRKRAKS